MTYDLVLFTSSFRLDGSRGGVESPNISHVVPTGGEHTLCGRKGWTVNEETLTREEALSFVCCIRCARKLERIKE
jgi:hypothetical protein